MTEPNEHTPLTSGQRRGRTAASLAMAEVTALGVGGVFLTGLIDNKIYHKARDFIAEKVILPHVQGFDKGFDFIERWIGAKCDDQCMTEREKIEASKPVTQEEHAAKLADNLLRFSLATAVGSYTEYKTHQWYDNMLGVHNPGVYGRVRFAEWMVKAAALGAVNVAGKNITPGVVADLSNFLEKTGLDREDANRVSSFLVRWQTPDLAANVSAWGLLNRRLDLEAGDATRATGMVGRVVDWTVTPNGHNGSFASRLLNNVLSRVPGRSPA